MQKRFITLVSALACGTILAGCGAPAEPAASPESATKETSEKSSSGMTMASAGSQAVFKVSGMDCTSCSAEVKGLISSQQGVKSCDVEPSGVVTVVFEDDKTSKEDLVELVNTKTNYKASL